MRLIASFVALELSLLMALGTTINDLASAWTSGPYIVVAGDSLAEGHNTYHSASHGGPSGDANMNLAGLFYAYSTNNVRATNYGFGGRIFQGVNLNLESALTEQPKYVFVHAGVNDIANGWTWPNILTNLNAIAIKAANSNALVVVSEILPWSNGTDANALTLRTYNTNLVTWAETNAAGILRTHDAFGSNRVSTSQLDDMNPTYDDDGVHMNTNGYAFWAPLMFNYFTQLVPTHDTPTLTKDPADQLLTDDGTNNYLSFVLNVSDLDADANRWQIRYSTNNAWSWITNSTHTYSGTYEVGKVWQSQAYWYEARVLSSADGLWSLWTDPVIIWGEMRPRNLYATANGTNSVTVAFDHVCDDEDGFLVERATDSAFTTDLKYISLPPTNAPPTPAIDASFEDDGFALNETYYYRVKATNEYYVTEWSNVTSVSPNSEPPQPFYFHPRNLTTGIKSTWQNGIGTIIYNYLQHSQTDTNSFSTIYAVTNTAGSYQYTHSGLTAGTTNYYRVGVSNEVGIVYTAPSLPVIAQYSTTATNWFVDADATGNNRGTNWANAWPNFASIAWNSINAGDIIYISEGTYNEFVYCDDVSGASNAPILFKVSQEVGHAGKVYVDYIFMDQNYIEWDGAADDGFTVTTTYSITNNINLVLGSTNSLRGIYVNKNPASGVKLKWIECEVTQSPEWVQSVLGISGESVTAGIVYQGNGPHFDNEIAYCWIHDLEGDGIALSMYDARDQDTDAIDVHHNLVERVRGNFVSASGGDFYNNIFKDEWRPLPDSPPGVHADGMQLYGSNLKVRNNEIRNTTGQSVYLTLSETNEYNIFIYNNLIYSTGGTTYTNADETLTVKDVNAGIQFTTSHDNVAGQWDYMNVSNVFIANNTFYGFETAYLDINRRPDQTVILEMRDWYILNNLFWNISTAGQQDASTNDYAMADVEMDYNAFVGTNTQAGYGSGGSWQLYADADAFATGSGWTHNVDSTPAFVDVAYQAGREYDYDFRVTTATASLVVGTNLSSWSGVAPNITETLDGQTRSGTWTIGAFGLGDATTGTAFPRALLRRTRVIGIR